MTGGSDQSGFDQETDPLKQQQALPGVVRHRATLAWVRSERSERRTVSERLVLGSSPQADVVIGDRAVSRVHCALEPRADGVWIRDLGSRNGTFVEGMLVTAARLPDHGRLVIGQTQLTLEYEREATPVDVWPTSRYGEMVGRSASMREMFASLSRLAPTTTSVLIEGETGTGKELVARALHDGSERKSAPFVVVDCGALPPSLIESELFGHVRGAFTGAARDRVGAVESAEGGTVFLDEIGELPLALQPRLLRMLESSEIRRLGEGAHRRVDVRFVTATHRNLLERVAKNEFREDLYFRIAVATVRVVPLRDRLEDVPLLVERFLPVDTTPDRATEIMREAAGRTWPGNVRELRNFVARAAALGVKDALALEPAPLSAGASGMPEVSVDKPFKEVRQAWLEHLERGYISALIERHGRKLSTIAQSAGLDRSYVHRLIRKHGL